MLQNGLSFNGPEGSVNLINPFKCQCCPHIETSQLICFANQLTGFYIRVTLAFNGLIIFPSMYFDLIITYRWWN